MSAKRGGVRKWVLIFSVLLSLSLSSARGQVRPRVVQAIDNTRRITLRGNVHPLARAEFDRGAVADGQPITRILLLLKRSDEQETALQDYLEKQQDKSSPSYHAWLTPEQFGTQYGPADADIEAVTQWLGSQGFRVEKVYSGKTVIEFSGTAGQVRAALGTSIRNYAVNGKTYLANASDPQIPAALAPVVAGIVSLNNFPRQSHTRIVGQARKIAGKPGLEPLFTYPFFGGNGSFYGLGPGDFAVIYNTAPLLSATPKTDGSGQTIAVVGETNINVADVQNFRQMFGLPANFGATNVILNGEDPGITSTGEETEADLDVQWSGAVAPGAIIDYVVSASTPASQGIDLSALYIIEHNLAGVMSESYGSCEAALGTAGNAFYSSLWEQAAAQGITAIVSTGDNGSAGCDDFSTESAATKGLAVNGLASTPYNLAVGGTDFDQVSQWTTYWNSTNDSVTGTSVKGYIPEIPWSDNCAQFGIPVCANPDPTQVKYQNIVAGGGGPSGNYTKPSWQLGVPGMPNDNHRDLPDVSVFSSPGFDESGYIICQQDLTYDSPCNLGLNSADLYFLVVGGTSASAPAFAGVMALVNQYQSANGGTARQGNADYVLYALAKKSGASCASAVGEAPGCVFNDVTHGNSGITGSVGTNSVPCAGGSPNCSTTLTNSTGILTDPSHLGTAAWTASAGYDLATGLGSVNVNSLATNWGTVSRVATTTNLALSPTTGITHGTSENVTVNISVTPTSGTAAGDVSLIAKFADGTTQGLDQFTLSSGKVVNGTANSLPGGTNYTVTAHYAGDGTNAPSDSAPVPATVGQETSRTFLVAPLYDSSTGALISGNATSVSYGSIYRIRLYVTNSGGAANPSGVPTGTCDLVNLLTCPTGTITLTANGAGLDSTNGVYELNNAGYTRDINPTLGGGTYSLLGQYSGDNSYLPSTSAVDTFTVTKAATSTTVSTSSLYILGTQSYFSTSTASQSLGVAPTGAVTVYMDGVAVTPDSYSSSGQPGSSTAGASLQSHEAVTFPPGTPSGPHTITATYGGDGNYAGSTSASASINLVNQTTMSLAVDNANVVFGGNVTLTAIIGTSVKTPVLSPSGIRFADQGGATLPGTENYTVLTDASGNTKLMATLVMAPQYSSGFIAYYSGDANFESNQSNLVMVTVTIPDFSVSSAQPGLTITAGQAANMTITITPTTSLSSPVQLQLPSPPQGITCALNPTQVELSGGNSATATLTCSVPAPSSSTTTTQIYGWRWPNSGPSKKWSELAGLLAALAFLLYLVPWRFKVRRFAFTSLLLSTISLAIGCGGGGGNGSGGGGGGGGGGAAQTMTKLSVASTKVQPGANLMATVAVSGSNSPSGQVTLEVIGAPWSVNTAPLVNGQAQFSYYLGSPGGYQMLAKYLGDSRNLASQIHNPLAVVQTGVAGALTVSANTGSTTKQIGVTLTVQ